MLRNCMENWKSRAADELVLMAFRKPRTVERNKCTRLNEKEKGDTSVDQAIFKKPVKQLQKAIFTDIKIYFKKINKYLF